MYKETQCHSNPSIGYVADLTHFWFKEIGVKYIKEWYKGIGA